MFSICKYLCPQVQVEVMKSRQKEKREMLEQVKRYRKGEFYLQRTSRCSPREVTSMFAAYT